MDNNKEDWPIGRQRFDISKMPYRMRKLPVLRGYPVPWFVAMVDGQYDFRIADAQKLKQAVLGRLCWLCGESLGHYLAFVVGPMCTINRVSSEPPSHRGCAEFSVTVCPFLLDQEHHRRDDNLPEDITEPAGQFIKRQPGVIVVWTCRDYVLVNDGDKPLFKMGEQTELSWWRQGRSATHEEVLLAINTGFPILEAAARADGPQALRQLEAQLAVALKLVPAESSKEKP